MSARKENRDRKHFARQAMAALPSHNDQFVADLNAMPKAADAGKPFGDIVFVSSHGGWFAECPITGYGYWYRTLREAVRQWRVTVALDGGRLVGLST